MVIKLKAVGEKVRDEKNKEKVIKVKKDKKRLAREMAHLNAFMEV